MANSAPSAQQCHALTTYYISRHEELLGKRPVVNRNKAKAGAYGILMDYTPTQAKEMIDFYLEHWDNPSIQWFLYNYELVDTALQEHEENELKSSQRRRDTAKRMEEWRNRWQK